MGLCRKRSTTSITACEGIHPATHTTNKSNSATANSAPARATSSPSGSSLTGSVQTSSTPSASSSRRASSHFRRMISRGVLTSPNPTNPARMFRMSVVSRVDGVCLFGDSLGARASRPSGGWDNRVADAPSPLSRGRLSTLFAPRMRSLASLVKDNMLQSPYTIWHAVRIYRRVGRSVPGVGKNTCIAKGEPATLGSCRYNSIVGVPTGKETIMARAWFGGRRAGIPARHRSDAASRVRSDPFHHRLRLEPLEDRRMLTAFLVDSLADVVAADGAITLREALEAANTNAAVFDAPAGSPTETDQITFAPELFTDGTNPVPGTITLGGTQLTIADDVDIEGPGAELLSIDANQQSRVFYVNSGIVAGLSGMTITNGKADDGGGVYNNGGTLTIVDAIISGNSATDDGGGIYSYDSSSSLMIADSVVSGNIADDDGAGIYRYRSSGTLVITNSTISDNSGNGYGGGICTSSSSGTATISGSTIAGNSAYYYGGGVYLSSDAAAVTNSTVSGNTARHGGGIRLLLRHADGRQLDPRGQFGQLLGRRNIRFLQHGRGCQFDNLDQFGQLLRRRGLLFLRYTDGRQLDGRG